MAKISEAGKQGEGSGKYFSSKDMVGQIFEIIEDVNLYGDQIREYFPPEKDGKKKLGKDGKPLSWLCILVRSGIEEKDLHLTNSALRAIRDVLPKGQMSAKGERLTMNQDAKGYNPAKFTRLMGDYISAMPKDQMQLGQTPPAPTPPTPSAARPDSPPAQVLSKLRYGAQFFPDGLIPVESVRQTIQSVGYTGTAVDETLKGFKDTGMIFEPVPGFYKVI